MANGADSDESPTRLGSWTNYFPHGEPIKQKMSIEYDAQAALGPQKTEMVPVGDGSQGNFYVEERWRKDDPNKPFVIFTDKTPKMQTFATGATRSSADGKNDYSGFLNPVVLREFGDYMRSHQVQADGALRSSRNWQKGITQQAYMESFMRHAMDLWLIHEGNPSLSPDDGHRITKREACCALMFNVMGYLLEELKAS